MGAQHTLHHGAPLTKAAQTAFEASGEQWTVMRALVFDTLSGFAKPASAYDIAESVSASQGRRIAANSVYRILDLFVAANLARKVESANAYVVNGHPDCIHDCIFLVCDTCGQATHLDDDALSARVRSAATDAGFSQVRPVIEVRGKCADCD
ncbi:Fur family transcriptional regulator [Sphingomonas sp.]|uniref:Fur family transcriptional regulator n=1 Tax=Sphingomonas sp. TaxID=28214 RepID=UPI0025E89666|nr:transcriptional repressor [Sphingomonas sp.]